MAAQKHVCGACKAVFPSEAKYLDHTCETTGFSPVDVEHQDALTDGEFSKQSEKALERGEARKGE